MLNAMLILYSNTLHPLSLLVFLRTIFATSRDDKFDIKPLDDDL